MKKLKSLIIILLLAALGAWAQPVCKVRTFGTANGLPASVVSGLAQSTDGLLWLTTWNGLSCYDGYRFTTFRNIPGRDRGLTTNHLISVLPASRGDLWVVAYTDDVYLFDSRQCQYVNISATIQKKSGRKFRMRKIYPLANGDAWIVGKDNEHYYLPQNGTTDGEGILRIELPGTLNKVVLDTWGQQWLLSDKGAYLFTAPGKTAGNNNSNAQGAVKPRCITPLHADFVQESSSSQWLATTDGLLLRLRKGKTTPEAVSLKSRISKVNAMTALPTSPRAGKNTLLAMATDKGLLLYDTRNGQERLVSMQWPGNPMAEVKVMFTDSRRRLWCFNDGAGVMMVDGSLTPRHLSAVTSGQHITTAEKPIFHEDSRHTVWLASQAEPFAYYDESRLQLVERQLLSEGVKDQYIPRIKKSYSDNQGNLWLIYPHNLSLVSFSHSATLQIDLGTRRDTRAVLQDHQGNIILGAMDGEIVKYSTRGELIGYLSPQGQWQKAKTKFKNHIYSLYEDRQSRLWIGTKGDGMYCLDNNKVTAFRHSPQNPYSLSVDQVYDIKEDAHGRLLVATFEGGLNISSTSIHAKDALQNLKFIHAGNRLKGYDVSLYYKVRRIEPLPNGVVLVATNSGLLTYDDNFSDFSRIRFHVSRHTADEHSLYSSEVMQTLRAKDGTVYVVTLGGGLQRIASENLLQDNLKLEPVSGKDTEMVTLGAGYGTMQGLIESNDGSVWVVGENRLACISRDGIHEYGADELGHANLTEALPSYSATTDRIVLATEGGALSFLPNDMKRSTLTPGIMFTSIRYMDRDDEQPILNTPRLNVDVDHRSFTLFFSAPDYSRHSADGREPSGIRYAYRMDDEEEWTYVHPGSNSISFNHFPPGTHTVSVRSTNADGIWMDNARQLTIHAQPTFIESWYGRTLITIILATLLISAIRLYMKRKAAQITEEATEKADAGKVRYMLRKPMIVDEDKEFMDKLLAYIEEHISDANMKIDDLSAAIGMGRSTFYGRLKQIADMSPNDFLRHVRMERAQQLVANSTMPFSQVAYATGFADPKYFGKCFKKQTGMSPSEYRKEMNQQQADETSDKSTNMNE